MPDHLLSDAQMLALQEVALLGMKTPITIQRKSTSDTDYGDLEEVTYTTVSSVKGWFYSTPTPTRDVDTGSVVTANTYRLFVPIGTDVRDGDQILVGSETYIVSDTTKESTWTALLTCSLRKRE